MARANPQWRGLAGQTALAIYSGPHAYVSPTWYETPNTVPTWNYAAVHAYGCARVIEDSPTLLDIVRRTVNLYEASMPSPWVLDETGTFAERLMSQIVGFRIEVERLEGKFKLNQNHPAERRTKVATALEVQGGEDATAIATMMREPG